MSYTIEVYRGHQQAERHFWTYALYVMFYPQLVAGPIERPQHLLHQFRERHVFNAARVSNGLRRMLAGFVKKFVIGDRLANVVDPIYASWHDQSAPALLLAAVCFGVQIYVDFSGYCDIAIGSANVMGFRLMENFRFPMWSRSVGEFWQRWHVSLTSWFRDYVFIPHGRRKRGARLFFSLMVTFFLAGLWHGPNWTFVLWALYFGLFFAAAHWLRRLRRRVVGRLPPRIDRLLFPLRFAGLMAGFVVGGVFFRSPTVTEAFGILGKLLNPFFWQQTLHQWPPANFDWRSFWIATVATGICWPIEGLIAYRHLDNRFATGPRWIRWGTYYLVILSILVFGEFGARPFVYFQF